MRWRAVAAAVAALAACACGSAGEGPPDATAECPARPAHCVDECTGCGDDLLCRCEDGRWTFEECPTVACSPVSQTSGCCAGEKCALITDQLAPFIGHVGCTPEGSDALGDPCTEADAVGTSDSCAAGGQCYDGRCVQVCTGLPDNCADGVCAALTDYGNPAPTEVCLPSCDPLAPSCAGTGEGCYVLRDDAICVSAGELPRDAACAYPTECTPGLQCVGNPPTCRPLCGPVADCWELDADGKPTTPTACGCGATMACGPAEICWPFVDGSGLILSTAGYCAPEDTLPSCSCSTDPICTSAAASAAPYRKPVAKYLGLR